MACGYYDWVVMLCLAIAAIAFAGSATTPLFDWNGPPNGAFSGKMSQYMFESCVSGNLLVISAKGCTYANMTLCEAEVPIVYTIIVGAGGACLFVLMCLVACVSRLCGAKALTACMTVCSVLATVCGATSASAMGVRYERENCWLSPPLSTLGIKIGYGTYCLGVGAGMCLVVTLLACFRPKEKESDSDEGAVTHAAYEPRNIDYAEFEQGGANYRARSESALSMQSVHS